MMWTFGFIIVAVIWYIAYKKLFKAYRDKISWEYASELVFLLVKIPKKEWEVDTREDSIQNMKSNIQVMEQILKNFNSIFDDSFMSKKIKGQKWVSLNTIVQKELIKFVLGIPKEFLESFEKTISSFYPGSTVDQIDRPKLLDAGKYGYGGKFILKENNSFPIRNYEKFEADPMDSLLSAFSKVQYDENLQLQILIKPVDSKIQKKLKKDGETLKAGKKIGLWGWILKIIPSQKDEEKGEANSKFSSTQTQDIDDKTQDELFSISIKTYAASPDSKRPKSIIDDLSRLFSQYNYVGLNKFSFEAMKNFEEFSKEFVTHKFITPKRQILNIKEVASIYHFPHSRFNKNPRIKWQNFKIVPAPDNVPTDWILLWYNVYSGVKKEIRMKNVDRFRHFYIIWQTGTGKSTMISAQAKQDMLNGNGFAIIDPHGDLCEFVLQHYPKERIEDLIYFDAGNTDYPFGLNILEAKNTDEIDIVTNDSVEMFIKLYGPEIFGPRIQDYFRNAAMTLMEQPEWGSLAEIMRMFTDEWYQKIKVKNIKNQVVRSWWEKTYNAMWDREKQEIIPYFQAKFGPLITNWILRNIIWQNESSFDINQVMQEGKVLLVNLSKGKVWELNSQLLGMIIVSKIKNAALARAKLPPEQRKDFFLYIDEFQNFVTPSIETILSEARKYRLGLILAHQYIDQLTKKDLWWETDLKGAIFGNIGTLMSYKVWAKDAEYLEQEYAPSFSRSDLINMDRFKWVMKLSIDTQPSKPFSLDALDPYTTPLNDAKKFEIIKKISMLKYGRKKDLVEKEIFYRVWG